MSAWKEMMLATTPEAYEEARRSFESECREDAMRDRDYDTYERCDDYEEADYGE